MFHLGVTGFCGSPTRRHTSSVLHMVSSEELLRKIIMKSDNLQK